LRLPHDGGMKVCAAKLRDLVRTAESSE